MSKAISESTEIGSFRELAKAIKRSPATALEWTRHEDWPFSRSAPWRASDVPKMVAWADENLRRDKAEDIDRMAKASRRDATAGFWSLVPSEHDEPLPLGEGVCNLPFPDDLPKLSSEIATPAEVAIAQGGPLPPADVVRDIMRSNILARARLAGLPHWLPSWMHGEKLSEARDMLAAAINEHVTYAAERISGRLTPRPAPKRRSDRPAVKRRGR